MVLFLRSLFFRIIFYSLFNLLFLTAADLSDLDDLNALIEVHHLDAGGNPSDVLEIACPDLYDDTCGVDHHDLVLIRDSFDADQITGLICYVITLDALSASVLYLELGESRSLAHSVFRREQKGIALSIDLHSDDLVVLIQIHANDAHCRTSQSSDCFLLEANAHTLLRDKENVIFRSRLLHFDQLIVFPEVDRYDTASADIGVLSDRCLLYDALFSHHKEIGLFIVVKDRYDRCDLFSRIQFQEIYDRGTSRRPARLRDLVSFHSCCRPGQGS